MVAAAANRLLWRSSRKSRSSRPLIHLDPVEALILASTGALFERVSNDTVGRRPDIVVFVIGKISGGANHGKIAYDAGLGFEIRSDSYKMVKSIFNDIKDIVDGLRHENEVDLNLKTISNLKAARLKFNHPLVKSAAAVLEKLDIKPVSKSTESALSIFLSHKIPAVTLGITHGENFYTEKATAQIEPMFKGIAQIIGVLKAIDSGVCDEK